MLKMNQDNTIPDTELHKENDNESDSYIDPVLQRTNNRRAQR